MMLSLVFVTVSAWRVVLGGTRVFFWEPACTCHPVDFADTHKHGSEHFFYFVFFNKQNV